MCTVLKKVGMWVAVRCQERASGQLDIAKATVFPVNMVYREL
jgi:hypothetical protein